MSLAGDEMACGCEKVFAKTTDELKRLRQTTQELTQVLVSLRRALEQQFEANKQLLEASKEEFDRESQ